MGLRSWLARVTGRSTSSRSAGELGADWGIVPPAPGPPTEADILTALDRTEAMVAGGAVPYAVSSRVRQVAATLRETLPRLRNVGMGSSEAYAVMATATDYLPEAIGGYLRLPRQWADSRPVENGKTSLMLLIDQLDLLAATMNGVLDAVVRVDADALIAHGRFLQEKFGAGASGGSLGLP